MNASINGFFTKRFAETDVRETVASFWFLTKKVILGRSQVVLSGKLRHAKLTTKMHILHVSEQARQERLNRRFMTTLAERARWPDALDECNANHVTLKTGALGQENAAAITSSAEREVPYTVDGTCLMLSASISVAEDASIRGWPGRGLGRLRWAADGPVTGVDCAET
ncbi:hypothetical protein J7I44_00425 [Frateuria sp. MAH-13]|uniref:Uncharacterized protein n=1 Tax=Frateuria flava TaxID=2821489 RepID=A0ABS4DI64_9GAMM|nr:hypothetical protein [Frateuria flava]MBP1472750.1 hypothetical protein [Frateuria flava]